MKNKGQIWYIGYIVSLFLIVIILVTDFPKMVDIGLAILFSAVFGCKFCSNGTPILKSAVHSF